MKIYTFLALMAAGSRLASASATDPDSALKLNEVTVTAIKQGTTTLRLQPIATTVVGPSMIDKFDINSMKGISEIAPNFYIPDYGSRMTSSIYVRGIGARIDQAAVGLNVDNVPYLNKDAYDFDLPDISRIEVMRGAQSSLYGRNTMAGQINIYTVSPWSWQGTRALAEISTGVSTRMHLSHYARLNDRVAMSVSGNFHYSDGFWRNICNGKRAGTDLSGGLRWKTEWRPTSRLSVVNTAAMNLSREEGYPYEQVGSGHVNYNDDSFYRRAGLSDGLTVTWRAPGFTLSSITSVQYINDNMTLDQDFTPASIFTLTQRRHEWSLTQDVVMSGKKGRYSWLAGAFAFVKRTGMHAPVNLLKDGISSLITDRVNNNPNIPIRLEWGGDSLPLGDDFTLPVWGVAVYHQSSWNLGRWDLGLGMRLDYEKTGMHYHSYADADYSIITNFAPRPIPRNISIDNTGRLIDHFLEFLPKLTVSYRLPMPGASSVYLSVGEGYKSGGFNNQMFSEIMQSELMKAMMADMPGQKPEDTPYDVSDIVSYKPERSWNFEAGTHVECADGRVNCDLAVFYTLVRDQQITMFPEGITTGRVTTNAERCRSWGAEAQIRFAPTDRWHFNLNYGYTSAEFTRFSIGEADYAGHRVPYAPAHTLFAAAAYRQPVNSSFLKGLTFMASCRGVGSIYWNEANSVRQPFYMQMELSATARTPWFDAEVWAKNLTDTDFDVFYFRSMQRDFLQRGAPRRVGLTVRFRFDS